MNTVWAIVFYGLASLWGGGTLAICVLIPEITYRIYDFGDPSARFWALVALVAIPYFVLFPIIGIAILVYGAVANRWPWERG